MATFNPSTFNVDFEVHPAANIFPDMSEQEYADLVEDIRVNGLLEAIWLDEKGLILDGRHRNRACREAGVAIETRTYHGDDPVGFVVSLNLHRRHLNESQRAMVASRIANLSEGRPAQNAPIGAVSQDDAAASLNVSRRAVQRAEAVQRTGTPELQDKVDAGKVSVSAAADIATLPQEEQDEVIARGEKEILAKAKGIRARRHADSAAQRVEKIKTKKWPEGEYRVLYADPPWSYSNSGLNQSVTSYEQMPSNDIAAMPVDDISTDDSVLFIWATSPMLADALEVISAWGFVYKTSFVWVKSNSVIGFYAHVAHEFLLVATRGSCTPDTKDLPRSVIETEKQARHSEKPGVFAELIDQLYPHGPRIELFARSPRDGWEVWGNETEG